MPVSAPRPCSQRGCNTLVRDGSGRCPKHPRETWVKTSLTKRITGRRLQAMRARLFKEHPLCVICLEAGRAVAATERDHIVSLEEGGPDDQTNEQALCAQCHASKSQAEAQRGRRRASRRAVANTK
ncbi:MAG: HNH endonuclease signature motif containing protein [Massilia sp.]